VPGRYRRSALAASLAAAALAGGLAGSLGTLAAKGTPPAEARESQNTQELKRALAQVKSEIAALQASVDKANLPALRETVGRLDKRMAAASAPEITGSIPQGAAAAKEAPKEPPKPAVLRGWVLRDVAHGRALVENGYELYEVLPGAVLPHVGRVESIDRQNGRWVVVTQKGLIVSLR